jgi:hypothetical protein
MAQFDKGISCSADSIVGLIVGQTRAFELFLSPHFCPSGLQAIDLLRLLLDVNAQLVAVLLLDLLVAELFGLVHSAIELCNKTVSPTLRQRAFFFGLVLPEQLPTIFQRV